MDEQNHDQPRPFNKLHGPQSKYRLDYGLRSRKCVSKDKLG